MKKNCTPKMLIIILLLLVFSSCETAIKRTGANITNGSTDIKTANDGIDISIDRGLFVGLIGNDSVFIKSETVEYWQVNPIVYLGNDIIYTEPIDSRNLFSINQSDVKIIQLPFTNIAYILLTKNDPPFDDKWLILRVHNKRVEGTYTAIKQILNNIDNDGFFRIGGRAFTEAVCLDCDSILYSPYRIFKLSETVDFDSALSEKLTFKLYGTFLGFNYIDTVLYVPEIRQME